MHPLELVSAAPWRRIAFTTYALSLSFFEAVILDALVRGGGGGATIFADPLGVRAGLSEQGARRAGREYDIEPVACLTGAFHPKLGIYVADADCHLTVGSGNLTFGGWGVNLECWEHLHPSFAADAFDDVADMLELLTVDDRVCTGAGDLLVSFAADMRVRTSGAPRYGDVRVLHSVGQSIGQEIADLADGLGGATALTVASPYFDTNAGALGRLCATLGIEEVHLHVHPGESVTGLPGTNWPASASVGVRPVLVKVPLVDDPRRLHAKAFEVLCRRGRLLVSGSANATRAGLYDGNIEASVARIQRSTIVGWSRTACDPPPPDARSTEAGEDDDHASTGVLRATLNGEALRGTVLLPRMCGPASLSCLSTAGTTDLGFVIVDPHGGFEVRAPGMEAQGWLGDRLTLRLEQGDKAAEGFVSLSVAADIVRRAGVAASRLLAMLAGTDTPEDVAAILAWFHEDPTRLGRPSNAAGGGTGSTRERPSMFVPADALRGSVAAQGDTDCDAAGRSASGWERAMALVFTAFSQARGPWPGVRTGRIVGGVSDDEEADEADESDRERDARLSREAAARRKAADALEILLDVMLAPAHEGRHARAAFWMAHYLADRSRPEAVTVRRWLRRILQALRIIEPERDAGIVAAALMSFGLESGRRAPTMARRYFIERGLDPTSLAIDISSIPGYAVALPGLDPNALATEAETVRTAGEQVQSFLAACNGQEGRGGFALLRESGDWPLLAAALDDAARRDRLHVYDRPPSFCPVCYMKLPAVKLERLRSYGFTSCCRLLLCTEDTL